MVVEDSKVLSVKVGQPIRFPAAPKGHYAPVELNKWLGEHTINVPDMHEMDNSGAAVMQKQ